MIDPLNNLPNEAVPWGRVVKQRLASISGRLDACFGNEQAEGKAITSAIQGIGNTLTVLRGISEWYYYSSQGATPVVPFDTWSTSSLRPSYSFVTTSDATRFEVSASAFQGIGRLSMTVVDSTNPTNYFFSREAPGEPFYINGESFAGMQSNTRELVLTLPKGTPLTVTMELYSVKTFYNGATVPTPLIAHGMSLAVEAI